MNWVTLKKLSADCGFTEEALRSLKKKGTLLEGRHWIKTPNGRIMFNPQAFEQWVTSATPNYKYSH